MALTPAQKQIQKESRLARAEAQHRRVMNALWGLPEPKLEHIFHPVRKWRMDYAWPDLKIALEIHGSTFAGGRHTRGSGYAEDREKMMEAQLLGWIVLEIPTTNLAGIRGWVQRAFDYRLNENTLKEV
ncbi:hypothetical protein [Vibrio breoganii]|uniref:hypothetical protein n=1 Tax=Vibrio breoganii TaxID=553239 RepID=UPI000C8345BC|nr:hypothetical protein [Vibrio breoganii]PMK30644.1 hypothetical protein BCU03_09510 [Vibrio breoganii]